MSTFTSKSARCNKRPQRGLGVVDVTIALLATALIMGAALALFSGPYHKSKQAQVLEDVRIVAEATRTIGQTRGTYQGLTEPQIVASGLIPGHMLQGAGIRHSLKGEVAFTVRGYGGNHNIFAVWVRGIPIKHCAALANAKFEDSHTRTVVRDANNTRLLVTDQEASEVIDACNGFVAPLRIAYEFF
jgi:hypothetical protein